SGEQRRDEERDAHAEGVGAEQRHALVDRLACAGDGDDGAQHRSDARRPAEGEGHAEQEGADDAGRVALNLEAAARLSRPMPQPPGTCGPMAVVMRPATTATTPRSSPKMVIV